MPIYRVPRDPPSHGLSIKAMVLDDPDYVTSAFDAYVDMSRDYSTWFIESSIGPIIGDVPASGGKVLKGTICAQVATGVEWRVHAETAEARVIEFKVLFTAREAYMQEEITRALAREREA